VLVLEKRQFVKDVDGYNGEHEDEYDGEDEKKLATTRTIRTGPIGCNL